MMAAKTQQKLKFLVCKNKSLQSYKSSAVKSEIESRECTLIKDTSQLPTHKKIRTEHLGVLPCSPSKKKKENNPGTFGNAGCPEVSRVKERRAESKAYQRVKQVLHTSQPKHVLCREKESAGIQDFLDDHLKKKTSGSLYLSGAPGTGKTALLMHLVKSVKYQKLRVVYLNCMNLQEPMYIYKKIFVELCGKSTQPLPPRDILRRLQRHITTADSAIILILDEIDQLDSKNQEILYTLFEWPSILNSKLILIGVANALDLTDRILPRLQSKLSCKPQLLHFAPYSKDQIVTVIEGRFKEIKEEGIDIMEANAVEFCARKVAAVSGDMRKALDICRRAIEVIDTDVKLANVLRPQECNSPCKRKLPNLQKIGIQQISIVLSEVYGCRVKASTQDDHSVPLQQKIAVCSLLLMVKQGKSKQVSLGKLHEMFSKVCRKCQVAGVDQSEFSSLCNNLETMGIIGLKRAKEPSLTKVNLRLNEQELEDALQDKVLMAAILKEGLIK